MKLSYNWLNEFIKIDDIDPEEIGLKLTMCTSEIESVEGIGGNLKKIVVGKILQVKPHPDSSHLFLTKIDVGHNPRYVCSSRTHRHPTTWRKHREEGENTGS
jgi:phenylalanyl-tRNA synthetase beta chain